VLAAPCSQFLRAMATRIEGRKLCEFAARAMIFFGAALHPAPVVSRRNCIPNG
jgi:hypothetical protein